jgi:ribosomal-protein-alanine N-acetyltransferase
MPKLWRTPTGATGTILRRGNLNGRKSSVAFAVDFSRQELGLHRLQAATLPHNAASQKILKRAGFEEIGHAPSYLRIGGFWQDHVLYQRILY